MNDIRIHSFDGPENSGQIMQLLSKDSIVFTIDLATGQISGIHKELVPIGMQITENVSGLADALQNVNEFNEWCASRVLALDRKYAKKIYNALGLEQSDSISRRSKIARSYGCVSLQDCYWVRGSTSVKRWQDVNLYTNSLSNALVPVALRGESLALRNKQMKKMPDISTHGTYAKAWERANGKLLLFKPDDSADSFEVDREVMASDVLDCFNVSHVAYRRAVHLGLAVSVCECMASVERSIVPFSDIKRYCSRIGADPVAYVKSIDAEGYNKMIIASYLIGNVDLHDGNWGMFFDPESGKLLRVFDLFDFNNAFDKSDYGSLDGGRCFPTTKCVDTDTGMTVTDMSALDELNYEYVSLQTMLEAAREAMTECSFQQIKPIGRQIFVDEFYLGQFICRCKAIGIYPEIV